MQRLQVSSNGRYLITEGGQPFFWLGHAAPADLDAAHAYLRRCRDQGYTVIQTDQPELVALAAEYGLYGALIADPGDDLSAGAALYGRYLRRMVRDAPPAVYLLSAGRAAGGDQPHWRELAAALDDPAALMAYQPPPGGRSSDWFAHDAWSAFHALSAADAAGVSAEWSRQPVRPALELHGDSLRQLYNVVFAGCCGVTCNHPAAVHLRRLLHSRPYLSRIPDQHGLVRDAPLSLAHP